MENSDKPLDAIFRKLEHSSIKRELRESIQRPLSTSYLCELLTILE